MIEIKSLSYSANQRVILEDLSFAVQAGELVAILGPSGTGKSSLLRLVLGLGRPTAGEIQVLGLNPFRDAAQVRSRCGYLADPEGLDPRLGAQGNLAFHAALRGLDPAVWRPRAEELLERLGIAPLTEPTPLGGRGASVRRRVALALAILHEPEVLLLDEPLAGLSAEAVVVCSRLLDQQRAAGTTILIATAALPAATTLADRVVLLGPRILAQGPPRIVALAGGPRKAWVRLEKVGQAELELLQALPYVRGFELASNGFRVGLEDPDHNLPDLVRRLVEAGLTVREARDDDPTLEELFVRTYLKETQR